MAPIKYWSAEFLEQCMAEHKRLMHHVENEMIEEIIDEVQSLPARAPRKSGRLFDVLPEPVQPSVVSKLQ
jgi:hypothetical protein